MTDKEFKKAMEKIELKPEAKTRIFQNIRDTDKASHPRSIKGWLFAGAAFVMVVVCLLAVPGVKLFHPYFSPGLPSLAPESSEQNLAEIKNWFIFQGGVYYSVGKIIDKNDVGEKLGVISEGGDPALEGLSVYNYPSVAGFANLIAEHDQMWELYEFHSFSALWDNRDEDAAAYLRVYGVSGPEEIASLALDSMDGRGAFRTISDRDTIETFYNSFSVLKNASDAYFMTLAGTDSLPPTPPDEVSSTVVHYTSPYVGNIGNKLDDGVRITIHFASGLQAEFVYYPHISFLNYYQLEAEAEQFFAELCRK